METLQDVWDVVKKSKAKPMPPKSKKIVLTYSMLSMYQTCRQKCKLRYFDMLKPIDTPTYFEFGTAIHAVLEHWYDPKSKYETLEEHKEAAWMKAYESNLDMQDYIKAKATSLAYFEHYKDEPFKVTHVEREFKQPLINPRTGRKSKTFIFKGKADGIVKVDRKGNDCGYDALNLDDGNYLLEHKTAGSITDAYLDNVELSAQTLTYAIYMARELKIPIRGVIYNIIGKSKLVQSLGETEEEYQVRYAELCANNKSGKSSAKRNMPESNAEFEARVSASIVPDEFFRRVVIIFDDEIIKRFGQELWSGADDVRRSINDDDFYPSRGSCLKFNSLCAYAPICKAGGFNECLSHLYERSDAHEELNKEDEES